MSSHHKPRKCFEILNWDDVALKVTGRFTERRRHHVPVMEIWDFQASGLLVYLAFKATPTGIYFNAFVRNSGNWFANRVS